MADDTSSWHAGPDDSFHGKITLNGRFAPEANRYHLYVGYFCPFAHRAMIVYKLKQLEKYAGIEMSIMRPYPKGDENGWPGWRFNVKEEEDQYEGATVDKLFGSKYLHEVYFKADKEYKGRYSVPVLWDKKTEFNPLLPRELQDITLYPEDLREEVDTLGQQLQRDLNTRVYKTGNATTQEDYEENLPIVFAMLNKLEKVAAKSGGPYILGKHMTEVDVRTYASLIRFDTVYVQHFKCNLGMIRYSYPILHNWLKSMYWNEHAFRSTTNFRHIKENYTKSHYHINPLAITPVGPWPDIESGVEADWSKLRVGGIDMPAVLEFERTQTDLLVCRVMTGEGYEKRDGSRL